MAGAHPAMFFERPELHRLAMWNFIPEADGTPNDPRSPAWDWHFVMRHPEVGKTYGYRARAQCERFCIVRGSSVEMDSMTMDTKRLSMDIVPLPLPPRVSATAQSVLHAK